MIVMTGATCQLGRGVIDGLLSRMPADWIVASVRHPAKAAALADKGVHVRTGDFAKPDGLATAFTGAEQVLVVSVDQHRNGQSRGPLVSSNLGWVTT